MKIFFVCSKVFYGRIPEIDLILNKQGHTCIMPNSYDAPYTEDAYRELGREEHAKWKGGMINQSARVIHDVDAILVLNLKKNDIENYIGGATFLEMYDAYRLGKKIYLYNEIPDGILHDEIVGFNPVIIYGDLKKV